MISIIATYHQIFHRADKFAGIKGIFSGSRVLAFFGGTFPRTLTIQFLKKQRSGLVLALLPGSALLLSGLERENNWNLPEAP